MQRVHYLVLAAAVALQCAPAPLTAAGANSDPTPAGRAEPLDHAPPRTLDRLRALITLSLHNQATKRPGMFIQAIVSSYGLIPRIDGDPDKMVDLKFQMQHWRHTTKRTLIAGISAGLAPEAYLQRVEDLNALRIHVRPDEYRRLAACLPSAGPSSPARARARAALASLIANQGDPLFPVGLAPEADLAQHLRRKGPSTTSIPGIADLGDSRGRYVFAQWSKDPGLSEYEYTDDGGVDFRGVHLLPGDVLLVDPSDMAAGTYASMGMPQSGMAHACFFVILTREGVRFPAVVDTGGKGSTRAIPLGVYLRPTWTAYVEVYRLRVRPGDFAEGLSRETQRFLQEAHPFDLSFGSSTAPRAHGSEPTYCPLTYSLIIQRLGMPPIEARSGVRPGLRPNLLQFGLTFNASGSFLSPSDYSWDPRFEFVAAIDNDQYHRSMIRSLLIDRLMNALEEGEVHFAGLPVRVPIGVRVVREIQARSAPGRLFRALLGFSEQDFPVGDARTFAMALYLRDLVGRAVRSAIGSLRHYPFHEGRTYCELRDDPSIQAKLDDALSSTRPWLTAPRGD